MDHHPKPHDSDLLVGAENISMGLYGTPDQRRSVYRLAETTTVPIFRLGGRLCARRSALLNWIAEQEARASQKREVA